jgi:hypothetical protein
MISKLLEQPGLPKRLGPASPTSAMALGISFTSLVVSPVSRHVLNPLCGSGQAESSRSPKTRSTIDVNHTLFVVTAGQCL